MAIQTTLSCPVSPPLPNAEKKSGIERMDVNEVDIGDAKDKPMVSVSIELEIHDFALELHWMEGRV